MILPNVDYSLDSLGVKRSLDLFPDQCHQVISEMSLVNIPGDFLNVENIVVSGMGGSALGGRVVANLERQILRVPVVVSTEYHLPNFVNEKTLVIVSSYSGNTEETVASLSEARARNAQIFILSSGGKLAAKMAEFNLSGYIFDPRQNICGQPRMGLGYNILAITSLLSRAQLINPLPELGKLPQFLKSRQDSESAFLELAKSLVDRIPVLISSEHLKGAAHCFKNQLNENSKTFAVSFDLPEINHHLLEGLAFPKTNSTNLAFLFIKSSKYHPELIKRYPLTHQVISKQALFSQEYEAVGPNRLFEVMDIIQMGSFVAFYLAILNGIDPGPIPWVNYYKDEMSKT